MRKKINVKNSSKNINKHPSLMTLSKYQIEEKNIKPAEEWIYGSLNKIENNFIINFKNQKAFKGYRKNRIDLYKLFFLIYSFNFIDQINNLSKKFELSQISNNFYRRLFHIYKEGNPIHFRQSLNNYKLSNKSDNKNIHKNNASLPNIYGKGNN